jgi:hypothetical protein
MGGYPEAGSSTSPTQVPLHYESPLKPEDERAAMAECVRGEALALRYYVDALAIDLPKQVLSVLQHQYEQTRLTYVYIENLREATSSYVHMVKNLTGKNRNGKCEKSIQPSVYDGHER